MAFDKADLAVSRHDAAEYLDSPEAQAEYLATAFETGDAAYIKQALSTLARARGMSELAKDADVTRQGLYKALSENGDPRLSTLLGVINSLGMRLSIERGS